MSAQQTNPLSSHLTPTTDRARGSAKLLAAWKARALTEESVNEIAQHLDTSPARVEGVTVAGGTAASGLTVSLAYDGDDTPRCGNDIIFWLRWHLTHGGGVVLTPPRIIINGTPYPDLVRMQLDFGAVPQTNPVANGPAGFNAQLGR
jgi:hypothetical protein